MLLLYHASIFPSQGSENGSPMKALFNSCFSAHLVIFAHKLRKSISLSANSFWEVLYFLDGIHEMLHALTHLFWISMQVFLCPFS
jgi:hypothetical protein